MKGGLISIIIYGIICLTLCYGAKLIIKLFKKIPNNYRTFPGVSGHAYGWTGTIMVSVVIILENIGRTMIAIITLWANILFLLQYEIFTKDEFNTLNWNTVYVWIGVGSSILLLPFIIFFIQFK